MASCFFGVWCMARYAYGKKKNMKKNFGHACQIPDGEEKNILSTRHITLYACLALAHLSNNYTVFT